MGATGGGGSCGGGGGGGRGTGGVRPDREGRERDSKRERNIER